MHDVALRMAKKAEASISAPTLPRHGNPDEIAPSAITRVAVEVVAVTPTVATPAGAAVPTTLTISSAPYVAVFPRTVKAATSTAYAVPVSEVGAPYPGSGPATTPKSPGHGETTLTTPKETTRIIVGDIKGKINTTTISDSSRYRVHCIGRSEL